MNNLYNVTADKVDKMKDKVGMSLGSKRTLFEKATSNLGFDYDTWRDEYYYESVEDAFKAFCAGMEWEKIV